MKTYLLTFKLKKHKEAKGFQSRVTAPDKADIQGVKEEWAMYFEKLYNTPVKCTNVELITDEPQQEVANERQKKKQTKISRGAD